MFPTDEEIKTAVVDELVWNSRVNASDLDVQVQRGEVRLKGTVPTYATRAEACRSVLGLPGVRRVDNQVRVEYPGASIGSTDEEMRENIRNALHWNSEINDSKIEVSVVGGTAILEGLVDSLWMVKHAEETVSNVQGVLDLDNRLSVAPDKNRSDLRTTEALRAAIVRRVPEYSSDIGVAVANGVVLLTGAVPSWREQVEAERIARHTSGVVVVHNQIAVRTPPHRAGT